MAITTEKKIAIQYIYAYTVHTSMSVAMCCEQIEQWWEQWWWCSLNRLWTVKTFSLDFGKVIRITNMAKHYTGQWFFSGCGSWKKCLMNLITIQTEHKYFRIIVLCRNLVKYYIFIFTPCPVHLITLSNNSQPALMDSSCPNTVFSLVKQ